VSTRLPVPGPRPAVPLITLQDGLLVESGGRAVVHVDVAAGDITLHLPGRAPLSFGLSTGGLDDASRTAALVIRRAIGRRPRSPGHNAGSLPRQGQLFGSGGGDLDLVTAAVDDTPGDEDGRPGRGDRLQPLLRDAILERCRAVARRRDTRVDDVAARVQGLVDTPLVYSAAVLDTPWLIDDVLRFRAAGIAVAMAETLPPPVRAAAGVRALIPLLSRWRALFARDGLVTRSVTRTLALLDEPTFSPALSHDVWQLRHVSLVEPVRSPRHLRLLAERVGLGGPRLERDARLLQLVDDDALDEAVDEVVRALRLQRLGERQREHVLTEVLSQAEPGAGDDRLPAALAVRTLVRRRLEAVRVARRRLPRVAGVAPVAVAPPIPLPDDHRLRFLVTEEDFLAEGERMHHCVGTYFSVAAGGGGYFFHYEDDDGPATVRVGRSGVVEEAKGVCNERSPSARRAAALLSTWGAPLTVLGLGDDDALLWHGAGPRLLDDDRPLQTLTALAQAAAVELQRGGHRDVVVFMEMLRGVAERALGGEAWLYFDADHQKIRAWRVDDDVDRPDP
jgi:hypothetical protein